MNNLREVAEKILGEVLREQVPSDGMVAYVESILREVVEEATVCCWDPKSICSSHHGQLAESRSAARAEALEEAANVAETFRLTYAEWCDDLSHVELIAAKIRALEKV